MVAVRGGPAPTVARLDDLQRCRSPQPPGPQARLTLRPPTEPTFDALTASIR